MAYDTALYYLTTCYLELLHAPCVNNCRLNIYIVILQRLLVGHEVVGDSQRSPSIQDGGIESSVTW